MATTDHGSGNSGMRLTRGSLMVLILICAVSACSDPAEREARYIRRGIEWFDKGDYQKARLEFRNAGNIKPTDPEVRYRLGLVDEAQGNLQEAVGNFLRAVQQDSHHGGAQLKLAQYALAAERYDDVENRLDVVLTDHPDDPDGHALRAALALRKKNFDETEKEASFALAKAPANVTAVSVLIGLAMAKDDEARVAELLNASIAQNPQNISLLLLKIAVYRKLNDVTKVGDAYRELFVLKPTERRYRVELSQFLVEHGRLDDAEKTLRDAVTALPADWDLKHLLVLFLSDQRGLEPAEAEVRAYMAANPKKDDLLFWLADLYLRHHAADRAVVLLEEVVAKDRLEPPGLNARTSLAKISFARGDRALAEKLVGIVLENAPGNHDALLMRAGMELDQGRLSGAVADLRSVLRDRPRDKEALRMLAEALVVQGHVDLAADVLSQLVDIDPLNLTARVRLAQMYHLNGDSKRALEALALVVKANPTYSVAWESRARIGTDIKNWPVVEEAIAKLDALEGQKMTAVYLRAAMAARMGEQDEAIRQFTEVVSADPKTPLAEHALIGLVIASRTAKRLDATSRFIEALHTDSPLVASLLGQCYAELGNTDAAAKTFDKLIDGKVGHPEPYLARAKLYLTGKNAEKAMDVLEKGQAAVPNNIPIPMMLAEQLGEAGRYLEAEAVYDDLLTRNPTLDAAANNLAELIADYQYSDPIAMEKARRLAERFQGSNNPLFLDTLGWVYYRQGKLPEAVATLERAVALGAVPAQVHYHYGAVLLKLNQNDQAKNHLEQATRTVVNYVGMDDAKRLLQSM